METLHKTFVFKLRPTRSQEAVLEAYLDATRHLYNNALEHRRSMWRDHGQGVRLSAQQAEIKEIRRLVGWEALQELHVHPLQDALKRLDLAFAGFFRRCNAGENPGFPRFRSAARHTSFSFKEYRHGWCIDEHRKRLRVAGAGWIQTFQHRALVGRPKTATIIRKADGWHVHIVCQATVGPREPTGRGEVGIDLGIEAFLTTSDGARVENPRPGLAAQKRTTSASQRVARRRKGSVRRRKALRLLARHRQREARGRRDFHHKAALALVIDHRFIAVEDLQVLNMSRSAKGTLEQPGSNVVQKAGLNRSILDAGWASFLITLERKAEWAGVEVIRADPRGTSQQCSGCGIYVPKSLERRTHACPACKLEIHRDHNAARNILQRAGQARQHRVGLMAGLHGLKAEKSPPTRQSDTSQKIEGVQPVAPGTDNP